MKVSKEYPNFSSGELSPKMLGRFDLSAYYSGCRRVENFIPQVVGSAQYRTGFKYVAKTAGNNPAFLYTFEYNNFLFLLEFTNLKVRFYQDNGQVRETAQVITGITNTNPAVVTYSGADNYTNGDSIYIEGVSGMPEVNGREFTVANVNTGSNTFELSGINSTAYGTYVSDGEVSVITEVVTPFTTADLFTLKFAQNGLNLYITHPTYNPRILTFTSATSWALTSHAPAGITLSSGNYPSAVSFFEQRLIYGGTNNSPQTLYFSKSVDANAFTVGTADDDGIVYTVNGDNNSIQWLRGTDKFLAIGVFGDVLKATGGLDDVITPSSISIKPSNSYGVADINPIGRGTQIFYVQNNSLILRSFEYDFESDGYIPVDRNIIADHITKSGMKQIAFQEGRPNIVWATRNDGVLIGMTIEDTESISGWHKHTTDGEFISAASPPREGNYNQLWVCVKRGTDYFIEYMVDEPEYPLFSDYFTGDKDADEEIYRNLMFEAQKDYIHLDSALSYDGSEYASVTLTPAASTGTGITFTAGGAVFTSDMVGRELWRKSVTGVETGRARITAYTSSTVVTCEILEDFDSTSAIPIGEWFLTADTLVGLDHLEGKTVSVVADGGQHPQATVEDGIITLDRQASVVHVGLPYTGWLVTMDLEGATQAGSSQTKRKSVVAVGIRFLNSLFCKFGTNYYKLNQIYMRTGSMNMDRPPLPYTGDRKEVYGNNPNDEIDGGWERAKYVIISQDLPFPCNIQLLVPYMDVSNV